jgi:hypothetical protein
MSYVLGAAGPTEGCKNPPARQLLSRYAPVAGLFPLGHLLKLERKLVAEVNRAKRVSLERQP